MFKVLEMVQVILPEVGSFERPVLTSDGPKNHDLVFNSSNVLKAKFPGSRRTSKTTVEQINVSCDWSQKITDKT